MAKAPTLRAQLENLKAQAAAGFSIPCSQGCLHCIVCQAPDYSGHIPGCLIAKTLVERAQKTAQVAKKAAKKAKKAARAARLAVAANYPRSGYYAQND